jgi:hypothetical protein
VDRSILPDDPVAGHHIGDVVLGDGPGHGSDSLGAPHALGHLFIASSRPLLQLEQGLPDFDLEVRPFQVDLDVAVVAVEQFGHVRRDQRGILVQFRVRPGLLQVVERGLLVVERQVAQGVSPERRQAISELGGGRAVVERQARQLLVLFGAYLLHFYQLGDTHFRKLCNNEICAVCAEIVCICCLGTRILTKNRNSAFTFILLQIWSYVGARPDTI